MAVGLRHLSSVQLPVGRVRGPHSSVKSAEKPSNVTGSWNSKCSSFTDNHQHKEGRWGWEHLRRWEGMEVCSSGIWGIQVKFCWKLFPFSSTLLLPSYPFLSCPQLTQAQAIQLLNLSCHCHLMVIAELFFPPIPIIVLTTSTHTRITYPTS